MEFIIYTARGKKSPSSSNGSRALCSFPLCYSHHHHTSCNESGISVAVTTLEMNPQTHCGGNAGNQQQNHGFAPSQINFSASTSSNVYYPFAVPLAAPRAPAVSMNYGLPHHLLPSYNNMPVHGGSSGDAAANHFEESSGSSNKRKNVKSSAGSSHSHPYESTSSSVNAPIDVGHLYYGHPPRYVGDSRFLPIAMDNYDRSVRVRLGTAGLNPMHPNNYNGLALGIHGTESFQTASVLSLDQTAVGNPLLGPMGCLAWDQSPAIPFMLGNRDRNLHQLPRMQGMRDHCFQIRPQFLAPHLPLPSGAISLSGAVGPRPHGSSRDMRIRTNQSQMRSLPETMQIRSGIPYLRYIDEVAIIDLPEHHNDHHSEMRMDIEHMSYEELLALGERIGSANTGLSKESITNQLRTRRYKFPSPCADAEESRRLDEEAACCIICLGDYQEQEELGCLDCGHDYHVDCLRKWMLVKNICPICKTQALSS
ncbi:hypothetical protein MLD38_034169 [Melastoma candidum]|uniref:Uncharacterized protein n=1 Tax=Melastoma candidum TaxID=119954 RepID=A0ACB9MBE9_9MYRT|nr:hypothetical protein MLD38_034169 [Melastoma candidum]